MSPSRARLQAAFRAAAASIDPARSTPARVPPELLDAWLTIHAVRGQTRWLDAAIATADRVLQDADSDPASWLGPCCRGWVLRAAPGFRAQADRLAPSLPREPRSVGPLLAYWRITGRGGWLQAAMDALPDQAEPGDLEAAEAFHQAWRATASEQHLAHARRGFDIPFAEIPLRYWPSASQTLPWSEEDLEDLADRVEAAAPEQVVLVSAALALPVLHLTVQWWIERELREGPVAEAATFPWPALHLSFERLAERDQVRFLPRLDGRAFEPIIDAGVVAAALTEILSEADRSPFLESSGRRSRRRLRR
ncbi:MAG: hypothetical protein VX498_07045 [Myxococcota bacterium]|nr:hypothetical protein [Myxococcota bacterium]